MRKKIILLFLTLMLVTGCTSNYNLSIDSNNNLSENISTQITQSDYDDCNNDAYNCYDYFITEDNNSNVFIKDNSKKYNKNLEHMDGYDILNLNYNYTYDSFKNSRSFNCFERHSFIDNKDGTFTLKLSGNFYCDYADTLNVNINIGNNIMISNNADSYSNNIYTWNIRPIKMYKNKEINLTYQVKNYTTTKVIEESTTRKVSNSNNNSSSSNLVYIIIGIVIVVMLLGLFLLYRAVKKNS